MIELVSKMNLLHGPQRLKTDEVGSFRKNLLNTDLLTTKQLQKEKLEKKSFQIETQKRIKAEDLLVKKNKPKPKLTRMVENSTFSHQR